MENDDDFFEGLFDDEDREIARKNALVSFYHDLTQAKEGVFINVSIGESGGVKYLIEHQYGSICRSHDLDEIRQDALNLIQIIDALTGSPGFNRGEYDKKVSESAQLYQEQQRAQYVPKPPKP
ncbi:MAG: hypothetical protein JWP57_1543, partial [Spirosoma sp.]|nr:hypothetical protein [Spirosoma sp.]